MTRTSTRLTRALIAGFTTLTLATACTAAGAETAGTTAANVITTPAAAAAVTPVAAGSLFDSSAVHSISITYDETEYQAMIDTFVASGDKEWITGTVTIDGTTYTDVGLKLKGNSTLQGLRGQGGGPGGGRGQTGDAQERPGGGGPGGDVSADDPAGLPWRIRLDKFVDGQNHQGQTDLVVRGNNTETSLNEAVALELLGEAGLATQQSISSRFSVNGSAEQLRLVVQNPNDVWYSENFEGAGLLYKAESGGDYSDRGDDPESYVDVFDLEAATDGLEDDYTPLIEFLDWLNNSDDATFAAELGDHLDIDAFTSYLAVQELVNNDDDIDGPGNNSYLQYSADTGLFTVAAWDQNLSFGGMGGGGFPGGGGERGDLPAGFTPPTGADRPEGFTPPDGATPPTGPAAPGGGTEQGQRPGGMGGGGMGARGGNVLSEKFLANADFKAAYEAKLTSLRTQLYGSGTAQQILDEKVAVLQQATDLVPADTITTEAAAIAEQFTTS